MRFLLFTLLVFTDSITALPFSSVGIGGGAAIPDLGAIAFGTTTGGISTTGSAAEGGQHVSTMGMLGGGDEDKEEVDASPEAELPLLTTTLGGILSRPVQNVPDYRQGVPVGTTSDGRVVVKRKVKKEYGNAGKVCWTVSKRCCYEEVHRGYECRDYYEYKYARCHPVVDYAQRCSDIVETPREHPKPPGKTKWEESIIKNYDANYGPHVQGYPAKGESQYYKTSVIPSKPHGVTGEPYPAPVHAPTQTTQGGYAKTSTSTSYAQNGHTGGAQKPSTPPVTGGAHGGYHSGSKQQGSMSGSGYTTSSKGPGEVTVSSTGSGGNKYAKPSSAPSTTPPAPSTQSTAPAQPKSYVGAPPSGQATGAGKTYRLVQHGRRVDNVDGGEAHR